MELSAWSPGSSLQFVYVILLVHCLNVPLRDSWEFRAVCGTSWLTLLVDLNSSTNHWDLEESPYFLFIYTKTGICYVYKTYAHMRKIDFNHLSSQLKRTRAQYPARITRAQFRMSLKGILNASESNRLFDYYLNRDVIGAISKTCFIFKQHQEYFSVQSLVELFSKNPIQTRKYCYFRDGDKEDLMKLHDKISEIHSKPKTVVVEEKKEVPVNSLLSFSDEQLRIELNRRNTIYAKRTKLNKILEDNNLKLEDLKNLIADCEQKTFIESLWTSFLKLWR